MPRLGGGVGLTSDGSLQKELETRRTRCSLDAGRHVKWDGLEKRASCVLPSLLSFPPSSAREIYSFDDLKT